MQSEWREVSLGEIGRIATGKTPLTARAEFFGGSIPFITPRDMTETKYICHTERYLSNEGAQSVNGSIIPKDAIVVSCIGSDMGKVAIAKHLSVTNQQINSLIVNQDAFSEFIYYALKTRKQELLNLAGGGSTLPILNKGHFSKVKILLPPLSEQRAIARILSSLDDKVELNRRTNATLESLVQTLFRAWFIDFEPVRAKAKGVMPSGMDAETAALFPSEFEQSTLGLIPQSWKVGILGDELATVLGGTPSRDNKSYWNGTVPWINSGKVNEFRIIEPSEYISEDALRSSATKLMPKGTTVIAITGATLGQVSLLGISVCANQSVVGVLSSPAIPTEYVYYWIKTNITTLLATQTGAAQQHINKNNVNAMRILLPDTHVISAFHSVSKPMFDRILTNCLESQTLAQLRDALLPRLISGQFRVPEEMLEGAPL